MRRRIAFLVAGLALTPACEPSGSGLIEIDGSGTIVGTVFVDANASGSFDAGDQPPSSLSVALVVAGTADTVARTRTNDVGAFSFPGVPVGRYEVVVPGGALSDTMSVVFRDPPGAPVTSIGPNDVTTVAVGIDDSVAVRIGVAYPIVTVEAARTIASGRRVFVHAVALGPVGAAAAAELHLDGDTRAIAARGVTAPGLLPGDSVRVFGVTGTRDGQRVLNGASAVVLASGAEFDTISLDAEAAASAGGGVHDARLVRVAELLAIDTARTSQRFIITAEDPSGRVDVSIPLANLRPEFVPGAEFSVLGLLVPRTGVPGVWRVHPRFVEDIVVHP